MIFHSVLKLMLMRAERDAIRARHQAEARAKAQMKAARVNFERMVAEHELQMIELRESRRDPDSEQQAEELIRRMRGC